MRTTVVRMPLAIVGGLLLTFVTVLNARGNPPFVAHDLPGPVENPTGVPSVMKLDSQGRPVFLFYRETAVAETFGNLELYRCNDVDCTSGTTNVVISLVPNSTAVGLALGPTDIPLVAYGPGGSLNFVDCVDAVCSTPGPPKTFSTFQVASDRGIIDLEIRTPVGDGALISQALTPRVVYNWCGDVGCGTGLNGNYFDSASPNRVIETGSDFSLTHNALGHPAVSMQSGGSLVAAFCQNTTCAGKDDLIRDLDTSAAGVGAQSNIAIDPVSGNPAIVYLDEGGQIRLAICTDADCGTAPVIRQLTLAGNYSWPSVAFRAGLPYVVAASGLPDGGIVRFECEDALCTSVDSGFADGPVATATGGAPSIAAAADFTINVGFWEPVTNVVRLLTLEAPVNLGDVDCDGKFEAEDALIIMRNLAGLASNSTPGAGCDLDVNDDTFVDMRDVHWIRLAIAGLLG